MSRIIAVDFDGTLCKNAYPDIGEPNDTIIRELLYAQRKYGDKLILWTCREGEDLNAALAWCSRRGLEFDMVNENLPEVIESFGNNNRKIYADIYLDDRAMRPLDCMLGGLSHEW